MPLIDPQNSHYLLIALTPFFSHFIEVRSIATDHNLILDGGRPSPSHLRYSCFDDLLMEIPPLDEKLTPYVPQLPPLPLQTAEERSTREQVFASRAAEIVSQADVLNTFHMGDTKEPPMLHRIFTQGPSWVEYSFHKLSLEDIDSLEEELGVKLMLIRREDASITNSRNVDRDSQRAAREILITMCQSLLRTYTTWFEVLLDQLTRELEAPRDWKAFLEQRGKGRRLWVFLSRFS